MRTTLNEVSKIPREERIRFRRELVRQFFIDLNLKPDRVRTLTIDGNEITARVIVPNDCHVDKDDFIYDLREEGFDSRNMVEFSIVLALNYLSNRDYCLFEQLDQPLTD